MEGGREEGGREGEVRDGRREGGVEEEEGEEGRSQGKSEGGRIRGACQHVFIHDISYIFTKCVHIRVSPFI